MHYQIPWETLHLYFDTGLEEKKSELPRSVLYPNLNTGNGLFTTIDRKKGDYLCRFPGFWMHEELQVAAMALADDSYAFHTPYGKDYDWPPMVDLVYMTHRCKANKINTGKLKDEVKIQIHSQPQINNCTS